MFEYLINTTEVYRVDTEKEAAELINKAKQDREYDLAKYSSTKKERKQKGEIIDEWYQVTLVIIPLALANPNLYIYLPFQNKYSLVNQSPHQNQFYLYNKVKYGQQVLFHH